MSIPSLHLHREPTRWIKAFLSLFAFPSDGHHLWEAEAKVDRDASKSVSDTRDAVIVKNPV